MKTLKKGFTLIELLIVVAIIGILATVVILNVAGARAKAQIARAKDDTSSVYKAVQSCIADGGTVNTSGYTAGAQVCAGGDSDVKATYPTSPANGWTYSKNTTSGMTAYMNAENSDTPKKGIVCDSSGCSQNKNSGYDTSAWY